MKMLRTLALGLAVVAANPAIAADGSWDVLRDDLYGERALLPADGIIRSEMPYRTMDDTRTQISAHIDAPHGKMIDSVTVILDENPMPVSAVFQFKEPQPRFFFDVSLRVNGPTPVHIIAQTSDGTLYMDEKFVKTSGTGACSAPPGTDPELALANMGEITLGILEPGTKTAALGDKLTSLASKDKQVNVDIQHPSHSGMQMDQISLLFIPLRYVENVEIDLDGQGFVDITGSISLSENPNLRLSVPGRTRTVDVTVTDTDGAVTKASKSVAGF